MNNIFISKENPEPIAIIGIGCRYPGGVNSPDSFWKLLTNEVDAIGEIPSSRMDIDALFDPRPATPGRIMTRWGGFLENIDQFDASFFRISPREADRLDPQQRLILEVAWEALEDAGEPIGTPTTFNSGVFVGCWLNDFEGRLFRDQDQIDFYMTTGSGRYSIPGRLSYFLGMQGPSISVDTACSSSLVSVHMACQSLRGRECTMALAGGTNVILQPSISIAYSQSRMMAPDGRCKFGDARGNGYVRSEGAAIIALKRLSDAIADQNPIYALIRGSAVNNDGRSSGFLTTPGGAGQEDMLRKAYQHANVSPGKVQYIEAHGTGTRAGDPVEIQALGAVLKQDRPAGQFCKVGSVKTNFGHTEGAAGIAGLIKVALSLKNRYIPASLHFQEPNPSIPWDDLPIRIQSKGEAWPEHDGPAIAGVSAFGIAGTNAHIVLQEAPVLDLPAVNVLPVDTGAGTKARVGNQYLVPLSARSPSALRDYVQRLSAVLENNQSLSLYDLGYTTSFRRTHHDCRTTFVSTTLKSLQEQFSLFLSEWQAERFPVVEPAKRKILFVFPGQGSQWIGMAVKLMEKEPVFREALERCSRAIQSFTGWSLIEILQSPQIKERIEQIDFIQPALFAMQVALAEQWRAWGIEPDAVAGHSMGEVAAATIAGAVSLEDAVRVICGRSQLMKTVSGKGAMISVDLSLEESSAAIEGYESKISIAVSNSPRSTVLSGDPAAIEEVSNALKSRNVLFRQVKVDVAAHSPQMEALRPLLEQSLQGLQPHPTTTPIYSTVTAQLEDGLNFDIAYWGRNLRQPVLFSTVLKQALDDGFDTIIEISPHPVLLAAIEQGFKIFKPDSEITYAALPSARRNEDEQAILLQSFGKLYELGHPVDWSNLYPQKGAFVQLPTYPWQREHYWLEIESPLAGTASARTGKNPLSGRAVEIASAPAAIIREVRLDKKTYPELFAHRLFETTLLPASGFIELVRAAAVELFGEETLQLSDVTFEQPLPLQEDKAAMLQVALSPAQNDQYEFRIHSREGEGWQQHVSGSVRRLSGSASDGSSPREIGFAASAKQRCSQAFTPQQFYQELKAKGILFDAPLRAYGQVWRGQGEAYGQLQAETGGRLLSLDPAFQLTIAALPAFADGDPQTVFIPSNIQSIRFSRPQGEISAVHARTLTGTDPNHLVQEIILIGEDGQAVVEINGLQLQRLGQAGSMSIEQSLYDLVWQPADRHAAPADAPTATEPGGDWLILADRDGLGETLARKLEQLGQSSHLVFEDEINLSDGTWFEEQTARHNKGLRGIVHLWSLDAARSVSQPALEDLTKAHERLVLGTVQLLRGISTSEWVQTPRIWLVARGAQPPESTQVVPDLAQTPLWGLGRVIAEEHPDAWGGLVDFDPGLVLEKTASLLTEEILNPQDTQIAFYNEQRLVLRLVRHPQKDLRQGAVRWRADCSYLITGGLGGIGLEVAKWMVQQGARRLILMGRTALPMRDEWSTIPADGAIGKRIAAIRELEAMGVSIHLAAVDSANEGQLRGWLEKFNGEGWPAIRGVIHAAGVTRDHLITQTGKADWDAVQRPKIQAAWLLHELLGELDFFVLFSSIGSILGLTGQGSYAAANAFLDGLASYRRKTGLPGLSIQWGPWDAIGMSANSGGKATASDLENRGIATIPLDLGLRALGQLIFRQDMSQVAVVPVDWQILRKGRNSASWQNFLSDQLMSANPAKPAETANAGIRETLLTLPPDQRQRSLESILQQQIAQVLKLPPSRIAPSKALGSFGLDSLMGIELRSRLEALLDINLAATFVWSYPTLTKMVPYIAEKIGIPLAGQETDQPSGTSSLPVQATENPLNAPSIDVSLENSLAEIESLSEDNVQQSLMNQTSRENPNG